MISSLFRKLFRGSRLYFWILANLIIALDQWSKIVFVPTPATNASYSQPFILIPGILRIIPAALNPKGAFSLGPDAAMFYIGASALGVGVITWFMLTTPSDEVLSHLALGSLFAGAVGNLIDRVTLGAVRDFIDLHWGQYHWPTFNVADMAICVGVTLLLWTTFTAESASRDTGGGCS